MAHTELRVRTYEVQLGDRGRLVLPAELRGRHRWRQGDRLRLIEEPDGTIRVISVDEALRQAQGMYAHLTPPGASVVDDLIADRRAEAAGE